jgi:hypothetical protein
MVAGTAALSVGATGSRVGVRAAERMEARRDEMDLASLGLPTRENK